ncbi:hypothetical protein RRG08_036036 [Elysia crispata]|uniref:Uncharacterized protein n=1 Tax=Elysia crispata TaxID=231223 RepID=A0AAE1AL95_9GAST|nr:hypothetical protein RRG08_036036 [Elysia crispata]
MFNRDVPQHLLLLLGFAQFWSMSHLAQLKNDSACYGTFNGYLNLVCEPGEHVEVSSTMYGVKPRSLECRRFATMNHQQPECCQPGPDDCVVYPPPGGPMKCPLHVPTCNLVADWVNTFTDCDQSVFPLTTNYMSVFYTCEKDDPVLDRTTDFSSNKPPKETDKTTPDSAQMATSLAPALSTEAGGGERSRLVPDAGLEETEDTEDNTTFSVMLSSENHSSDVELSDSMVAAVVGGSIGMCLTLVLFIFYWGRKKRLRIVSNKQPTVWDYLLTNTFTVRGYNGYDHFSSKSTRSSASSEGDGGSPVIRKNMWLPNIIQSSEELQDDAVSNYDNTNYKVPKVEVHPGATPSPYAILNLESLNSNRQRDNHEV